MIATSPWPPCSGRTRQVPDQGSGGMSAAPGSSLRAFAPAPIRVRGSVLQRRARKRSWLPQTRKPSSGSCPNAWCNSARRVHRDLRLAGIGQAAMSGRLTSGLSPRAAMVSRLK